MEKLETQFILSQQKQQALQEQAPEQQRQQILRLVAEVAQQKGDIAQESGPNQFPVKFMEDDDLETYLCTFERTAQMEGCPKPKWPAFWYPTSLGRPRSSTST